MPERFKVVFTMQGAIQVLGFTFTFTLPKARYNGLHFRCRQYCPWAFPFY